jgi:hypothetical protein
VTRGLSHVRPVPRRGLSRDEAAMYIGISATKFDDSGNVHGISATKFDDMVRDGRMPQPMKIDNRKIWDIRSLDLAFDQLSAEYLSQPNSWEGV